MRTSLQLGRGRSGDLGSRQETFEDFESGRVNCAVKAEIGPANSQSDWNI